MFKNIYLHSEDYRREKTPLPDVCIGVPTKVWVSHYANAIEIAINAHCNMGKSERLREITFIFSI